MEDILNNLIKLPFVTKVAALAGAIVAMTAVNYFVWPGISGIYEKTTRTERKLATLQEDLDKKQAIANHLNQYRKELEVVEQRLREALTEMPEEVKIDQFLSQLSELAKKAGLTLQSIQPQSESKEAGFYYKIPIKMKVEGGFHEIAVFLDSVSKLKRIINVNNISLGSPKMKADKIVLTANYLATTFRFAGDQATGKGKGKKSKRGRGN